MDAALIAAWATVALVFVTAVAAGVTCLILLHGIRAMNRSSDERAKERKAAQETDRHRHEEAMARHDATMEALRALIARTAPPSAAQGDD